MENLAFEGLHDCFAAVAHEAQYQDSAQQFVYKESVKYEKTDKSRNVSKVGKLQE